MCDRGVLACYSDQTGTSLTSLPRPLARSAVCPGAQVTNVFLVMAVTSFGGGICLMRRFSRETRPHSSCFDARRAIVPAVPRRATWSEPTVVKNENVSTSEQRKITSTPVTAEECREQARHCMQEANKVKAHRGPYTAWLTLAERWLDLANSLKLKSAV